MMMVAVEVRLEIEAEKFRRERVDYTAICGRSSRVWKPATGGEVVVGVKGLVGCCRGASKPNAGEWQEGNELSSQNWSNGLRWMGLVAITGSKIVVRYAYGIRRELRDDPLGVTP
jgi:hypothetical protein